jgi:hypothetical protein
MTQPSATQQGGNPGSDKNAIRPFHVNVPEAELAEMRRRIKATEWPDRETVTDESQGVLLETTQAFARYWGTEYDWRKRETRLNALPQFITEIDGLDIHFIHVRSKHENALPLIVTHGWPGSVVEQLKIIDPLTNPAPRSWAEQAYPKLIHFNKLPKGGHFASLGTAEATELQSSSALFFPLLALPSAQARRAKVRNIGYGVRSDFELNFGRYLPSFGPADDDTDTRPD